MTKLSQITSSSGAPASTDVVVGVQTPGGTPADLLYTLAQVLSSLVTQGVATLNTADQTVTGGANVTTASLTTGNVTIDCGTCPLQKITNGGAFSITAPANDGSCLLLITNNASAGAVSFSGFSVGSNTGDALDTTNTHKFTVSIWRINSISGYRIAAHQ